MSLSEKILTVMQRDYDRRLNEAGVPNVPSSRTPDEANTAAAIAWAVTTEAAAMGVITQAALEGV